MLQNRYSAVRHAEMTAPMEVTESDATVSEALSTAIKEELGARTVPGGKLTISRF